MIRETLNLEDGTTVYTRRLDGISEAADLSRRIATKTGAEREGFSSITGDEGFTRTKTLDEAIHLFEHGWVEGASQAQEALVDCDLADSIAQIRPTVESSFDVSGDEPDVDRFIAGEPENMMIFYPDQGQFGKVLELKVNVAQHAYVSERAILRRGVVVSAAAGLIATAGFGLQIDAVEHIGDLSHRHASRSRLEYTVPIAQAGDYFSLDAVIFALAHPSFLRRILFAVEENEDPMIRDLFGIRSTGGYGMPETIRQESGDTSVIVDKDDYLSESWDTVSRDAQSLAHRLIDQAAGITQGS